MSTLKQLFYLSRAAPHLNQHEVRQILQLSQRNNRMRDITGCLLYTGAHFAQILEGDPASLHQLFVRIAKDPRHFNLAVVVDRAIDSRRFPNWSMGLLYKTEIADRMEALLSGAHPSEEDAALLFDSINPDSVMGTL